MDQDTVLQAQVLVKHTDPILHKPCKPFVFDGQQDPVKLAELLTEIMITNEGLGLSANQVGIDARVCVVAAEKILAMFNPKIVDVSEERILLDEGCLSYPGLTVKVRRPKSIRVRYTQPNGNTVTEKYTGMTARVIQHEIAHLDGRTMLDDCSIVQREQATKKLKRKDR